MNGWAIVYQPRPVRLTARRRSRCWKCDSQMVNRERRLVWWCAHCRHVVSYSTRGGWFQ